MKLGPIMLDESEVRHVEGGHRVSLYDALRFIGYSNPSQIVTRLKSKNPDLSKIGADYYLFENEKRPTPVATSSQLAELLAALAVPGEGVNLTKLRILYENAINNGAKRSGPTVEHY